MLKTLFSFDPNIRFAKQISKGDIRVIQREDDSLATFIKERLFNDFSIGYSIFIFFFLILFIFTICFHKVYVEECAIINGVLTGVSALTIYSILIFTLISMFPISIILAINLGMKVEGTWQFDYRSSTPKYNIEKYWSDKKIQYFKICRWLVTLAFALIALYSINGIYQFFSEKFTDFDQYNQHMIDTCQVKQSP